MYGVWGGLSGLNDETSQMQRPNTPGPWVLGSGAADKSDNGRDRGISTHTRYFASGTEKSAADWDNNVRSYLASALKTKSTDVWEGI